MSTKSVGIVEKGLSTKLIDNGGNGLSTNLVGIVGMVGNGVMTCG